MNDSRQPSSPVLALHGFTLGGAMFAELAELVEVAVVAPDLPGHGGRDAANTTWDRAVGEVVELVANVVPAVVLGYSMGGRLALAAALREPAMFRRLVLVSTSLGIEDEAERAERRRRDEQHAATIEESGSTVDFIRGFAAIPFLQTPEATVDLMAIRLANRAEGIAGALRGMGQGAQPYLGDDLSRLDMPITWMAGIRDQKYTAIARRAAAACPRGEVALVDAAHNVIAEQPAAVVAAVLSTG